MLHAPPVHVSVILLKMKILLLQCFWNFIIIENIHLPLHLFLNCYICMFHCLCATVIHWDGFCGNMICFFFKNGQYSYILTCTLKTFLHKKGRRFFITKRKREIRRLNKSFELPLPFKLLKKQTKSYLEYDLFLDIFRWEILSCKVKGKFSV